MGLLGIALVLGLLARILALRLGALGVSHLLPSHSPLSSRASPLHVPLQSHAQACRRGDTAYRRDERNEQKRRGKSRSGTQFHGKEHRHDERTSDHVEENSRRHVGKDGGRCGRPDGGRYGECKDCGNDGNNENGEHVWQHVPTQRRLCDRSDRYDRNGNTYGDDEHTRSRYNRNDQKHNEYQYDTEHEQLYAFKDDDKHKYNTEYGFVRRRNDTEYRIVRRRK